MTGWVWGFAFGLADGLPVLLQGDPLTAPGRRALALLFLTLWNALAFGLALAPAGAIGWAALRLARRPVRCAAWLELYAGFCAVLSVAAYAAHRYPAASPAMVAALAALAGVGAGRWVQPAAGGLRIVRRAVPVASGAGLALLIGVAVVRGTVRDWKVFNPRMTAQAPAPAQPNILLISVDALRADRLGVYGHQPSPSPRLDELARRGLVFRQAIAQGSSTVPAIASFMTSLYPTELGMIAGQPWAVDEMRVTLAEALQVAGYRTQAFVANGHLVPDKGYAQGFDGYVAPEPGRPYDLDWLHSEAILPGLACKHLAPACRLFDSSYRLLFDPPLVLEDEGARINARARRFIRLHRDEQFFLWLHYMEPHAAYNPTQPHGELPAPVGKSREAFLRGWQPSNKTIPAVLGPEDRQALWALYDGEVRDVDRLIGEIWDEIEAQGLADRTLLVITADHGDEFGDHGDYGHGHSVYQELVHVPLIFVGPPVSGAGRAVDQPVAMLDLMPTLLDVAHAPLPGLSSGQSLLSVLHGSQPSDRPIYAESPARRGSQDDRALYLGEYKLVYHAQEDRAELYHLRSDPAEQHDRSSVEPQRAAAMRTDLRAWTAAALHTWASLPQAGLQSEKVDAAMEDALRRIGY